MTSDTPHCYTPERCRELEREVERLTNERDALAIELTIEASKHCKDHDEVERLRALLRECVEIGNALAHNDGGRREWLDLRFRICAALGEGE